MISDDDIRRVREATDLVELVQETVVLKQSGREFWGRCPFHDEKTPSFKVDPRSQLYHCFGCNAGGDSFGFVMRSQNMEFLDAVRYLASRANIELVESQGTVKQGQRARLLQLMDVSANFYSALLLRSHERGAEAARAYLSRRNMGLETARHWQLGYAPGNRQLLEHLQSQGFSAQECLDANVAAVARQWQQPEQSQDRLQDRFFERVMFPVADLQGQTIAFGGRVMTNKEPKYLNSSETLLFRKRETLYGLDKAKATISAQGVAIVVEGYTDTIAMHAAGFTNTVATLGTALTLAHLKLLNRFAKKVIYLFDGDEAGKRAAVRAAELITPDITPEAGRFRVLLEVAELPTGMDPADFLAQQGPAAMQETLDESTPLLRYAIRQSLRTADLSSPEGRNAALRAALFVLLPVRGSVLANTYIADELAPQLGADYAQALALFNSLPKPREIGRSGQAQAGSVGAQAAAAAAGRAADAQARVVSPGSMPTQQPDADAGRASMADLQNDLLVLYIEYPEVRKLLAQAFASIPWSGEWLPLLARTLLASDIAAESEELYAALLDAAPAYAPVLAAGQKQDFSGSPKDYADLLLYMLRLEQIQNEIALAKIAYGKESAGARKDALFEEIANKQAQLAEIREKMAEVPKTLL